LVAFKEGRVVAQGTPHEVVTPATVREVFGLEADVIADPQTGTPLVVPHRPPHLA
jgi:iron complex transport system ATP-binding protein